MLSFLFIHLYEPFQLYSKGNSSQLAIFWEMTQAILIAAGILIITQFPLRKVLKLESYKLWQLIGWFILENMLIGSIWFALSYLEKGIQLSFIDDWMENTLGSVLLLGPPYFLAIFTIHFRHKSQDIEAMRAKLAEHNPQPNQQIPFLDEYGKEKISLRLEDILFLESSDNYVDIYYLNGEQLEKYVLRNTLKKLEESLSKHAIIRCHRSFMVNLINVLAKHKKGKGLELELRSYPKHKIPVSQRYLSEVEKELHKS